MYPVLTLLAAAAVADEPVPAPVTDAPPRYVFQIEPIKPSSLMLNIHPDWAAFGIEAGVRLSEHVWVTTFVEIDKGSLHQDFAEDGFDFLTNHHYTAWMTTGRWVFSPHKRASGFADAGVAVQWLWQQYLDPERAVQSQTGMTLAPVALMGFETHLGKSNAYFKVRGGGGVNAHRQGGITGLLDLKDLDTMKRGYFSPYTHLTEVMFQRAFYIGDVAFGFKFGAPRRAAGQQ